MEKAMGFQLRNFKTLIRKNLPSILISFHRDKTLQEMIKLAGHVKTVPECNMASTFRHSKLRKDMNVR